MLLGITAFVLGVSIIAQGRSATLPHTTSRYDLRGSKIYSTICVDDETGDVNGWRVFVRRSNQQPRILVQYAEGSLEAPEIALSSVIAGRLSFAVPDALDAADLRGEVQGDHIVLHREGTGPSSLRMDLVQWQNKAPYCRA